MKYKYSIIFLSVFVLFLFLFIALFLKSFSDTETIPYTEYVPTREIEQEALVRPESWDKEIPPTIETPLEIIGTSDFVPYKNEKFGFEISVPNESKGNVSEGGLNNKYYIRLQNFTDDEIYKEYTDGEGKMKKGWYFLEMYINETTESDPEKCVSDYAEDYWEVDLGQGVKGFMYRPDSYGGDGPSNGVTVCTIKDGYKFDIGTREDIVSFDDKIVKTFKFIN